MTRQQVNLPSKTFKSKSDATAYFKEMLNRYNDGDELNSDDDTILFELLQRHPEADDKIGVGVKRFYRAKSPIHPTSCFHIERYDGTTTDFSYPSCISGNTASLSQQFYEACRFAVSQDLIKQKERLFKDSGGTMICEKTGANITINEADYRHTSPRFREIVRDFIKQYNITISPDLVTHSRDMQYVVRFVDSNIESLFKKYHATKAHLGMYKKYER